MAQPKIKTSALEFTTYTINTTGGTTILSGVEAESDFFVITGALTSDAVIRLPSSTVREYRVTNATTGPYKVRFVNAANLSAGYAVLRSTSATILNNGTDVVAVDTSTNNWNGEYGWQDLRGSLIGSRLGSGTNAPTWTTIAGGVAGYTFNYTATEDQVWVNFHIPHDYVPGTPIYIHVHWSPTDASAGDVRWGCEYTVAKGYSQQAFGAPTTVYLTQAASGTALMHQIVETPIGDAISGANLEVDALVLMRFFRNSTSPADTYNAPAFAHEVDLHYQSTLNKTTKNKNYPFY